MSLTKTIAKKGPGAPGRALLTMTTTLNRASCPNLTNLAGIGVGRAGWTCCQAALITADPHHPPLRIAIDDQCTAHSFFVEILRQWRPISGLFSCYFSVQGMDRAHLVFGLSTPSKAHHGIWIGIALMSWTACCSIFLSRLQLRRSCSARLDGVLYPRGLVGLE